MTGPKKPPHHDDHKDLPKKVKGWVDTFRTNLSKDYSRADIGKIRSAMTWREKLTAMRLLAAANSIRAEKDPHKQMQKLRQLMPQVESLLPAVERGLGKKLEEFGKYLPDEAKTQVVANSLRTFNAKRLADVVEAHIPPAPPKPDASDAPPKAPRHRPLRRQYRMPMPA